MRAALLRTIGAGPEGVEVAEMAAPVPADGELLVAVGAVTASKLELEQTMTGLGLGRFVQPPRVLGNDPVGVVVAAGPGASADLVGRRVAVKPNLVCGRCASCLRGAEADCTSQQMFGVHRDGGAAQFVTVPQRQAFAVPESVDDVTAAGAVHSVAVALHLLRAAGEPGAGDTVLVTGATGAVGSAAVALAHAAGATVLAAASTAARASVALGAGADAALDYAVPDRLAAAVREHVPGGVRCVVETTGRAAVLAGGIDALGWGGVAVTCASQPGERVPVDIGALYRQRRTLRGVAATNFADVRDALTLVADGIVAPKIAAVFPLEQAVDAYRALADRDLPGKVIITVAGPTPA